MPFSIRRIRPEDAAVNRAARLAALVADPASFGATYEGESRFDSSFWTGLAETHATSEDKATLLAFSQEGVIGLARTTRHTDRADVFGVYSVWVEPRARRAGVGRALLVAVEAWAIDHGATSLELLVSDTAAAARALYERLGYAADGYTEAAPHGSGTESRMIKRLR